MYVINYIITCTLTLSENFTLSEKCLQTSSHTFTLSEKSLETSSPPLTLIENPYVKWKKYWNW